MKSFLNNKKRALLAGVLTVLFLATAGVTLALLIDKTNAADNTFVPSEVTCEVGETFNKDSKTNVYVKNTGDTDAFIRAAIVVTWQDGNKNIAPEVPVLGTDYTLEYADDYSDNWFKKGEYHYYVGVVDAENGVTEQLIKSCEAKTEGPEGYSLCVEIIADAVQAEGKVTGDGVTDEKDQPVEIAWKTVKIVKNDKGEDVLAPIE